MLLRCWPAHQRMYVAAFLLDFSVAMGLTATPFFIFEQVHLGVGFSGLVGAVQMALYASGCLLSAGFVSRAPNGLHLALGGISAFALLFLLVPTVRSPLACLLMASLPFLGLALAWPAMQTWLGLEPDSRTRARHLAWFNTATAFGFTLSPLFAGPLFDFDFRLPFLALFLICAVVLGFILSISLKSPVLNPKCQENRARSEETSIPLTTGLLYAAWAATFTANGLVSAVRSVYPMRVKTLAENGTLTLINDAAGTLPDTIGSATLFSWLAFLLSLATVATFALFGRTRFWQGRFSPLLFGQLAAALAFALLGQTRNLAVMVFCVVLVGINFGISFFISLYYSLARASTSHKYAAVNEGLLGAGGFTGAICIGFASENFGIPTAFLGTPVLVTLAILVQILLLRKCRK